MFIAKYDSAGTVLWAKKAGGMYDDVGLGLSTDASGHIYLTGYFYSPQLIAATYTITNAGAGDLFIIKYDASGNELWVKNIGGNNDEGGNAITCDNSGNIIVTGYFQSALVTVGNFSLQNTGSEDVFTLKFDPAGNALWASSMEGTLNDRGNGISCDATGNIFVTGDFYSGSLVNGNDNVWCTGSNDVFVARYDSQGNILWIRSAGGNFNDSGHGISVDPSGQVTIIGTSNSSSLIAGTYTLGNAGNFDLFIIRYSSSGNITWARQEGGIFDDTGYAVVSDPGGNVFVTGHSHSPSIIFGTDTLINNGVGDVYVAAYSPNGLNSWVKQAGGSADDGSSGVAIDPSGNIFVSGYFLSSSVSAAQFTLSNSGGEDLFLGKLKKEIPVSTLLIAETASSKMFVSLYPNPTSGTCVLYSEQSIQNVEVYDGTGRRIYCVMQFENQGIYLDFSPLAKGLYWLKISGPGSIIVKKLVCD